MFTAFHHFCPSDARSILAAAVRDRQAIAVAEFTYRSWTALALMLLAPIAVWAFTPLIRPFKLSRLFWTYVIPVIPAAAMFDGIVSCIRTYSPSEMLEMGREVGGIKYDWVVGCERPPGLLVPVTYLIGTPKSA